MNILIAIPSPDFVSPSFAFGNLYKLISHTRDTLGCDIFLAYQQGVRTDRNRNIMLKNALDRGDIDYIVWLDADMMYPHDMIEKYINSGKNIIGCIYYKRVYPHAPIAYVDGGRPTKPYKFIDPTTLPINSVVEVSALGFGGLLVKTDVYIEMGDDAWSNYDDNFHLPFETINQRTHDLVFCEKAKKHGFKIHLHTGVKPGHLTEKIVTEKDFDRQYFIDKIREQYPTIAVVMPVINVDKGVETMKMLEKRAGVPFKAIVIEDKERTGFVATVNRAVKDHKADFYVYIASDAFPGRNWLKNGLETITSTNAGVLAFNSGKWNGKLPAFGMVRWEYIKNKYNGDLFYCGYKSHYADTELGSMAKCDNKYAYNSNAVLMEVDYEKDKKSVNNDDRELYIKRTSSIINPKHYEIWSMFA